jgi:hypothetical protein
MQSTTERLDKAEARKLGQAREEPETDRESIEKATHAPDHEDDARDEEHGAPPLELARIAFVAVAVLVSWLHLWRPVASFDAVAWGAPRSSAATPSSRRPSPRSSRAG